MQLCTLQPSWGGLSPPFTHPRPLCDPTGWECLQQCFSQAHTRTQEPPALKVCTLFWPHTGVFCIYCNSVSWQSLNLNTSYSFKQSLLLIQDHSPRADRQAPWSPHPCSGSLLVSQINISCLLPT